MLSGSGRICRDIVRGQVNAFESRYKYHLPLAGTSIHGQPDEAGLEYVLPRGWHVQCCSDPGRKF